MATFCRRPSTTAWCIMFLIRPFGSGRGGTSHSPSMPTGAGRVWSLSTADIRRSRSHGRVASTLDVTIRGTVSDIATGDFTFALLFHWSPTPEIVTLCHPGLTYHIQFLTFGHCARMSEIEYGRLGLYDSGHWKSNHLVTLGFKGLIIHSLIVLHISQCKPISTATVRACNVVLRISAKYNSLHWHVLRTMWQRTILPRDAVMLSRSWES